MVIDGPHETAWSACTSSALSTLYPGIEVIVVLDHLDHMDQAYRFRGKWIENGLNVKTMRTNVLDHADQ